MFDFNLLFNKNVWWGLIYENHIQTTLHTINNNDNILIYCAHKFGIRRGSFITISHSDIVVCAIKTKQFSLNKKCKTYLYEFVSYEYIVL